MLEYPLFNPIKLVIHRFFRYANKAQPIKYSNQRINPPIGNI